MKAVVALPLPTQTSPAAVPARRISAWAATHPRSTILAGCTALSFALFAFTWASPFTRIIGVPDGDPTGSLWALSWPLYALAHGHSLLFTDYLHSPSGVNLMWTYPPLPALIIGPVTALAGPVFAYNLLTTMGLAVSAWLMSIAAHRFVPSWRAAVAAGVLFGFGPFVTGQALDHVVLTMQFAAPLLLLLLHEALVRQRWRPWLVGMGIGGLVLGQLLTFAEGVAILALFAVIGLIAAWLVRDPSAWPAKRHYAVQTLLFGAAATAAFTAYPLAFMLFGPQHLSSGSGHPHALDVSNLANIVVPAPTQLMATTHDLGWRTDASPPNPAEWDAYLGIPLLVICGVVVSRCWNERRVRFATLMASTALVLSLGPSLTLALGVLTPLRLPALALSALPWFNNVLWSRLAAVVDLFVALLLAIYIARARTARPLLPRRWHVVAMALLVVTLLPRLPYPSASAPPVPSFFISAAVDRIPAGSVALVAPYTNGFFNDNPEYWQAASGFRFRLVGAYAFVPGPDGATLPPLTPLSTAMLRIEVGDGPPAWNPGLRNSLLTELRRDAVRTVIVGPMPNRDVMVAFVSQLLGRDPVRDRGVEVWWNVQ